MIIKNHQLNDLEVNVTVTSEHSKRKPHLSALQPVCLQKKYLQFSLDVALTLLLTVFKLWKKSFWLTTKTTQWTQVFFLQMYCCLINLPHQPRPVKTRLEKVFCSLKCRHFVSWCCCAAPLCLYVLIIFFSKWKCTHLCSSFIQDFKSHVNQFLLIHKPLNFNDVGDPHVLTDSWQQPMLQTQMAPFE